jgi:hypothetical protein
MPFLLASWKIASLSLALSHFLLFPDYLIHVLFQELAIIALQ